jgi:hypothetical protein
VFFYLKIHETNLFLILIHQNNSKTRKKLLLKKSNFNKKNNSTTVTNNIYDTLTNTMIHGNVSFLGETMWNVT